MGSEFEIVVDLELHIEREVGFEKCMETQFRIRIDFIPKSKVNIELKMTWLILTQDNAEETVTLTTLNNIREIQNSVNNSLWESKLIGNTLSVEFLGRQP